MTNRCSAAPPIALLLLLMLVLPQARAQTVDGDAAAGELAGINRTLARLVGMFESSLRLQQADLVLKRIELRERRLEPAERALRGARESLDDQETHLEQLAEMLESFREDLQAEMRDGLDQPRSETRRTIGEVEAALRTEETRRDNVVRRIRDLEDEIAEGRERIEELEEVLQELLE